MKNKFLQLQKISLMGYMGSGKSLVGKTLTQEFLPDFIYYDLDQEIERNENRSIPELFITMGEIYFRKIERQILEEILHKPESIILSLGGGTPAYYDNISSIVSKSIGVFLQTSPKILLERLTTEAKKRPLLPENLSEEWIGNHLFERLFYYSQADMSVKTDAKSSVRIAEEIFQKLCL